LADVSIAAPNDDKTSVLFEEVKTMFELLPVRLLEALDHRVPSLVDPIGPHWNEWVTDARTLLANLWSTSPTNRATAWGIFMSHVQEFIPRLTSSSALVATALANDSETIYRQGITAFENACVPYFDSPSRVDQEATRILRSSLSLLRHWLDTQAWGRGSAESAER